jgi:hypothetical protein
VQEASKQLKAIMDKKFGAPWQVAIGEGKFERYSTMINYLLTASPFWSCCKLP